MLIQSRDVKYPDMVKVLSAAQRCLMWEPRSSVIEKRSFLLLVSQFAFSKIRTLKFSAKVRMLSMKIGTTVKFNRPVQT